MGKQTSENVIGIICKRQDWLDGLGVELWRIINYLVVSCYERLNWLLEYSGGTD